jgi:hypothetical protein
MEMAGDLGQSAKFFQRVNRADLGSLGQAEGMGLRVMNIGTPVDRFFDRSRRYFPVVAFQQEHLGAIGKKLGRTALGHLHVRNGMAKNAVVGLAKGGQSERVCRGAVEDEKNFAVGLENVADQVGGFLGPGVVPITDFVALVGLGHGFEGFGADARVIIAREVSGALDGGLHGGILVGWGERIYH